MKLLLSGLVGALIASSLSVFYHYITEQIRFRRELMIKVVEWVDDIYERLQVLCINKEKIYNGQDSYLTHDEYKIINREVKVMLLSDKIKAMVALTYGEGEEVQKINALQGELTKVAEIFWNANKDTWPQSNEEISKRFNNIIDPLRESISRRFLTGATVHSILNDFLRKICPTFYKAHKRIKRGKK